MTAYINKLKDKTGNQQLPVTHERAVRDDNGTTLESKMQNLEGAMDKAYVTQSDNGMGRITLKKNMVSGINTLTQNMMQAANTIYIIQYDFTLGEDITVPANCVLEFDGGSISAGSGANMDTIIGNSTLYVAKTSQCIFNNVILDGTFVNNTFNVLHFCADRTTHLISNIPPTGTYNAIDITNAIRNIINSLKNIMPVYHEDANGDAASTGIIFIPSGKYYINSTIYLENTKSLKFVGENRDTTCICCQNATMFTFGSSSQYGCYNLLFSDITFKYSKKILTCYRAWGGGFEKCNFYYNDYGIELAEIVNFRINGCKFVYNGTCIFDFGATASSTTLYILNSWFQGNGYCINFSNVPTVHLRGMYIDNCIMETSTIRDIEIRRNANRVSDVFITNCDFEAFEGITGNIVVENCNVHGINLYYVDIPNEDNSANRVYSITESSIIDLINIDSPSRVLPNDENYSHVSIKLTDNAYYVGAIRPNMGKIKGWQFFDTTLNKPIYWTGDTTKGDNGWVDANGNFPQANS